MRIQFLKSRHISHLFSSIAASALLTLAACSEPSFTVKGEIENADGGSIVLEKADHAGFWIPLDSARLSSSGKFSIKRAAPSAPEIFRLRYGNEYVYFPIDSIETVTLKAPANAFATEFTLEGSDNAQQMERFEKELIAFSPMAGNPDSTASFKRHIYSEYLQNSHASVVSYYILTKVVGSKSLFGEDGDDRYFAAVATAFRQYRPDDPRTALLEDVASRMRRERRSRSGQRTVIEAPEINLVEIELPDEDGNKIKLSEYVGNIPTLLMFCDLSDAETPAINARLRTRSEQGKFKVYQIGLDKDRLQWRNAAKNLPWATLYGGSPQEAASLAQAYMIPSLPAFFIIDANGNLTARANDVNDALKRLP